MTPGCIYVETGGDDLIRILMFDQDNKRKRSIERDKRTDKRHVHAGYYHAENGQKDHDPLTDTEKNCLKK